MKITDHETFKENPFQNDLGKSKALKFSWRHVDTEKLTPMVDADSGETVFLSAVGNVKVVLKDNTEFTKFFGAGCQAMLKLSSRGSRLLAYLLTIIKRDKDEVCIDVTLAQEWCGYSSRTQVYAGIESLLDCNFICRKTGTGGEYYINVNYFFNGKRTNLQFGTDLKSRLVSEAKRGKLKITDGDIDDGVDKDVEE